MHATGHDELPEVSAFIVRHNIVLAEDTCSAKIRRKTASVALTLFSLRFFQPYDSLWITFCTSQIGSS